MAESLPRVDPPFRSVDGSTNARLTNTDPSKVYCLANPNDEDTGVEALKMEGWTVESHRKDGPRLAGGKTSKEGDALTWRGQYVMSKDAKEWKSHYQTGQDRALAIDQQILKPGGIDGVRGGTGRLAQNMTVQEIEFSRS